MTDLQLPPHISYSQVNTYLTCGEQYRLERLKGVKSIPGWAATGGTAVHAVCENFNHRTFDPDLPALSFDDAFDEAIAANVERSGYPTTEWSVSGRVSARWPDKENEAWWRENGPIHCKQWEVWVSNTPWEIWVTPEGVPAIELQLNPTFGGMPDKLAIDVVMVTNDGEMVVVDIKSGSRVPPSSTQLGDYAVGMEQLLGIRPSYGTFWMARSGSNTPPVSLDHYTQAAIDYRYSKAREGMEAGIFIAQPSNLCASCGVRDACYAVKGKDAHLYVPWA